MQRSAQHMAGQPCRAAPPPVCLPVSCARIMCRAEGGEVVGQVPRRPHSRTMRRGWATLRRRRLRRWNKRGRQQT